jgi:hypothetical protein
MTLLENHRYQSARNACDYHVDDHCHSQHNPKPGIPEKSATITAPTRPLMMPFPRPTSVAFKVVRDRLNNPSPSPALGLQL